MPLVTFGNNLSFEFTCYNIDLEKSLSRFLEASPLSWEVLPKNNFNSSRPNPGRREKIKLNVYLYTSFWCLKRFWNTTKKWCFSFNIFLCIQTSRGTIVEISRSSLRFTNVHFKGFFYRISCLKIFWRLSVSYFLWTMQIDIYR